MDPPGAPSQAVGPRSRAAAVLGSWRLLLMLIAFGVMSLVVVTVIGFSSALYTSQSTSPGNEFEAGSIDLRLGTPDSILNGGAFAPGDTRSGTQDVTNVEHKASVRLSVVDLGPDEVLGDVLRVVVLQTAPNVATPMYDGTLRGLTGETLGAPFAAAEQRTYRIEVTWPADQTDRSLEGATATFDFEWLAESVSRWRRVGTVLSTVAMIVAIAIASLMIIPALLGYERYVIVSGSMAPEIPTGSIVYDEVVPVEDLEVGEVISFVPPPEYGIEDPVTHRIVNITKQDADGEPGAERIFRTKGDANEHWDAWKMILDGPEQARMKYHLPYVGYIYMALNVRWVQILLIGIPAFGIAVLVGVSMWRVSGDAVREERENATREPAEVS